MKYIILLLIIGSTSVVFAQKNSLLVAGSISYSIVPHEEHHLQTFSFNPKIGYGICEHFTTGLYSNLSIYKHSDEDPYNSFTLGGFVRYTKAFNDIFGLYTEAFGGYKNNTGSNLNGYELGFAPAVYANIGKAFSLTMEFGGVNYSTLDNEGNQVNTFNINLIQMPKIGIQKIFNLKK